MRKPTPESDQEPGASVVSVNVRQFRAQLRLFLNAGNAVRVVNRGRNVGIYLPCGTRDWSDRYDWAKQARTLKRHFRAALESLPKD